MISNLSRGRAALMLAPCRRVYSTCPILETARPIEADTCIARRVRTETIHPTLARIEMISPKAYSVAMASHRNETRIHERLTSKRYIARRLRTERFNVNIQKAASHLDGGHFRAPLIAARNGRKAERPVISRWPLGTSFSRRTRNAPLVGPARERDATDGGLSRCICDCTRYSTDRALCCGT
ncbi:hypothetical protein EVAR_48182_1 [Eumeta japonica]|uniref:Uncharacterized protein n=1 Tax=Eumeta variegata TaxID=151549 RepID=A0A4C1XX92_EUMVA|nr:hypothetical protein EVAR_48182_1 [Eumeta japonica]